MGLLVVPETRTTNDERDSRGLSEELEISRRARWKSKASTPHYCGKRKKYGTNIQVLTAPDGTPLWASGSLLGAVHDLKATRISGIPRHPVASGMITLADEGASVRVITCACRTRTSRFHRRT
ncbi:transposase family protein [Streptosporangium saharense]|uniref:transposase family protein n=1 Tax=Streptosporangium saharense TaxID=1706840 RepID=UPI003426CC0B